jgi:hypothetical protein
MKAVLITTTTQPYHPLPTYLITCSCLIVWRMCLGIERKGWEVRFRKSSYPFINFGPEQMSTYVHSSLIGI